MKKFIFGLMLLVSMLGIVGCNFNDSDDPAPVVYTIYNETEETVKFSYMSNSGSEVSKTVESGGNLSVRQQDTMIDETDGGTEFIAEVDGKKFEETWWLYPYSRVVKFKSLENTYGWYE